LGKKYFMMPRINVFSIADDTPVREAAQHFWPRLQPYSGLQRTPWTISSCSALQGLLKIYIEQADSPHRFDTPVGRLVKPVLYTPETKKISHLSGLSQQNRSISPSSSMSGVEPREL